MRERVEGEGRGRERGERRERGVPHLRVEGCELVLQRGGWRAWM